MKYISFSITYEFAGAELSTPSRTVYGAHPVKSFPATQEGWDALQNLLVESYKNNLQISEAALAKGINRGVNFLQYGFGFNCLCPMRYLDRSNNLFTFTIVFTYADGQERHFTDNFVVDLQVIEEGYLDALQDNLAQEICASSIPAQIKGNEVPVTEYAFLNWSLLS